MATTPAPGTPYDYVAANGNSYRTSGVLYDAQGKPYTLLNTGQKSYVSPAMTQDLSGDPRGVAFMRANPAPQGGFLHGDAQWDSTNGKWTQGLNGGNLLALGVGSTIAAPFIAGAVGGAAGGAASAADASAAIPVTTGSAAIPAVGSLGITVPSVGADVAGTAGAAGATSAATDAAPALSATDPGAVAGDITDASQLSSSSPSWMDLLKTGGQLLTSGAQGSANQDAANNNNAANYLRAQDADYTTKLNASVNVPAGLNRQALWTSFLQNLKTSNPNAPATNIMTPDQQNMLTTQKAAIMAKLAAANAMPLPTAPVAQPFQQPGAGTKAASDVGSALQVASQVPWSKLVSLF